MRELQANNMTICAFCQVTNGTTNALLQKRQVYLCNKAHNKNKPAACGTIRRMNYE